MAIVVQTNMVISVTRRFIDMDVGACAVCSQVLFWYISRHSALEKWMLSIAEQPCRQAFVAQKSHSAKKFHCLLFLPSVDNTLKVGAFQCSTADKTTVDIRFSKQFGCIAGFSTTAIEDRSVFSHLVTIFLSDN